VPLPSPDGSRGIAAADAVTLTRSGDDVYLAVLGNPAGGASGGGHATLYLSHDAGQTWTRRPDPCPQPAGGERDATAVGAAPGLLAVACPRRGAPVSDALVVVSRDGGSSFNTTPGRAELPYGEFLVATGTGVLLAGGNGSPLVRSADAGRSWQRVTAVPGSPSWLGFETDTVGRAVSGGELFTTRDAGATWQETGFK
jgi:photosystem II stability/assembly factor-like uncharacterized protein